MNNTAVITQKQNADAQILSSKLQDAISRKRAYIDFTGAMHVIDCMQTIGLRATSARSVFKCSKLYSDFEIVDIYCNSHMLYVVTSYGTDIVKIPLMHKNYNILPEAYIVLDLKIGMKEAELKGIILPQDLESTRLEGKYFKFNINNLRRIDEIIEKLRHYAGIKNSVGKHLDCMNLFIPYIDNKLNEEDKNKLIGHILTCETCKKKLIEAIEFDLKAKTIENHETILPKEDLGSKDNFVKNITSKSKEGAKLQGAIDMIYKDKELKALKEDNFKYRAEFSKKMVKLGVTGVLVIIILTALVVLAFNISKNAKKNAKNKTVQGVLYDEPTDLNSVNNFDVDVPKIISNKDVTTVSKVSWEVSSDLTNKEQKNFLQVTGKSIRLNLQNDLLLSNEAAVNNRVKFDIKFLRDGSLDEITINESSGTGAVDEIVKQSIENTLQYMHPPKGSFVGNKGALTLVVDF